jgi:hypothetical protein
MKQTIPERVQKKIDFQNENQEFVKRLVVAFCRTAETEKKATVDWVKGEITIPIFLLSYLLIDGIVDYDPK